MLFQSSDSGSGSGTQTKTCAQSKNNVKYGNNMDSSEESENRNIALSCQDGSDDKSGTQVTLLSKIKLLELE